MDVATLAGLGMAFGLILGAVVMEGGNPVAIFLIPPMVLVFGGTFGAVMAGVTMKDFISLFAKWMKAALMPKVPVTDETITTIVKLAERARREGLLALEDAAKDIDDPFLKRGLELAIDGTDPDDLREILELQVKAKKASDKIGEQMFTDMGGYSPTIGIVGTVFGLIHVLENLSQPDKLGHLIAGAFVATLWGVLSANVIWLPMGKKIKRISGLEAQRMELVIEGVLQIQAGGNPRLVGQKLNALVGADAAPAKKAA